MPRIISKQKRRVAAINVEIILNDPIILVEPIVRVNEASNYR